MTSFAHIPYHIPFFKRHKRTNKYVPLKGPSRFQRNHHMCGDYIPYVRFWLNRPNPMKYLTLSQLMFRLSKMYIRKFTPSLMANDINGVQPMEAPSSKIFTLRCVYTHSTT